MADDKSHYTPAQRRVLEEKLRALKAGTYKPNPKPRDWGERYTDDQAAIMARKLKKVYAEAAEDLKAKSESFRAAHEQRVKKYRAQVAAGQITEEDYRAWMRGQVFQGEQWRKKREQLARHMADVDAQAMRMINDGKTAVFAESANYLAYRLENQAGANLGFGLYDRDAVNRLIREEPRLLPRPRIDRDKDVAWYNRMIGNAVTQGILQGEDLDEIVMRVALDTGERSLSAMRRNVRTAYTGAQNAGRLQGLRRAQALGVRVKKRWMATLDAATRDAHADLDGQTVDVDAPFESALGPIMYPGDPSAAPGNVYNCRCTIVYVYEGVNADYDRVDDTGENVGALTYREWKAAKAKGGARA